MTERVDRLKQLLDENEVIHRRMKLLCMQSREEEFNKLNETFLANAKLINAGLADA